MKRLQADLTLLLVALIWGSSFAAQRVAAEHVGPFLFNGSRFILGALILLPLIKFKLNLNRKSWLLVALAGTVMCGASALQQAGLQSTTAGNAGFITCLYVVIVPVMMFVFWKQRTSWITWVSIVVAVFGMFLMSSGTTFSLASGDGLEFLGAFLWAAHVVIVGKAMQTMDTLHFAIGQYLINGILNIFLGLILEPNTLPGLMTAWWAILYIGLFSVAIGFTLQAKAQKQTSPTDVALILSLESVFAAIFGYLFLHEILSPLQLLGAGLMLTAIIASQFAATILEKLSIRKKGAVKAERQ